MSTKDPIKVVTTANHTNNAVSTSQSPSKTTTITTTTTPHQTQSDLDNTNLGHIRLPLSFPLTSLRPWYTTNGGGQGNGTTTATTTTTPQPPGPGFPSDDPSV